MATKKRVLTASQMVEKYLRPQIDDVFNTSELRKFKDRNSDKIHPLSVEARTLGGAIQSANIRYGNQLQVLVTEVLRQSRKSSVHRLSGTKVSLPVSRTAASAIEQFITERSESSRNLVGDYERLSRRLKSAKPGARRKVRDVDLLIQAPRGPLLLVELKFNDDHDTGKRPDIFRKVLLTADGLRHELRKSVTPVVCYFNSAPTSGVKFLPSHQVVDGEYLLSKFAEIKFSQLANAIRSLGPHFDRRLRPHAKCL